MKNSNGCAIPIGIFVIAFLMTLSAAAIILLMATGQLSPFLAPVTSILLPPPTLVSAGFVRPGPSDVSPAPVDAPATLPAPESIAQVGRTVSMGNWQHMVATVEKTKTLIWGHFDNETDAQGTWLLVSLRLKNVGKQSSTVDVWDFHLHDAAGARYDPSTLTFSYVSSKGLAQLGAQFPPAALLNTALLFDISPDSRGLKLHFSQGAMSIDLGE